MCFEIELLYISQRPVNFPKRTNAARFADKILPHLITLCCG